MIWWRLAREYRSELVAAVLLCLPPVALIALGGVWLWQRGHILAFLALCLVAAVPATALTIRHRRAVARAPALADMGPQPDWPAREREAFAKVIELASIVEPLAFDDRDAALTLVQRTLETVASHYRPDAAHPIAAFTLPEGLLFIHRVSDRLRSAVLDSVPFSERLTLSDLREAFRLTAAVSPITDLAMRAYNVYRVVRPIFNPAGAAIAEARQLLFGAAWDSAASGVQRKLTRLVVIETGRAAIELYSGRLRRNRMELDAAAETSARHGATPGVRPPPLRILFAGQVNAGKSSLANALAGEIHAPVSPLPGPEGFRCFEVEDLEGRGFVFVDAPGVDASAAAIAELAEEAKRADVVLWDVAAHQAARDVDARCLGAFRTWFAGHPELNRPPILCVATHVDQLSPFTEWAPPYDIVRADRPKSASIRDAVHAIANDLDVPVTAIIPVSLAPGREPYNLDVLRARIASSLPEARHAQLARAHSAREGIDWFKEASRLVNAGRSLLSSG